MSEERVKPCMECGTVLPFDAELCSLCGVSTRPATVAVDDPQPIKPCLACQSLIPESSLFCPDCGDFTLSIETQDTVSMAAIGSQEGSAATMLTRGVSILIAACSAAMLVAVLFEFARTRAYAI